MVRVKGEPSVTIPAQVEELELMFPALAQALARDSGGGGEPQKVVLSTGGVVNGDVLQAMVTLSREIPDVWARCCDLVRERHGKRGVAQCLIALPRLGGRLHQLGLVGAEQRLAGDVGRWTSQCKGALGLRTPDIPLRYGCPACGGQEPLVVVGSEGFLRLRDNMVVVVWQHAGVISCGQCQATWTMGQWMHLGRLLKSSRSSLTPARSLS